MAAQIEKKEFPPYASYASFRNFINKLAEDGVPARIDKSLMPTQSGGQQSAILATLRWFALIDDDGRPSSTLKQMAAGSEENYKSTLRDVITESYFFLTDGSLDLSNATAQQVEETFKGYGIQGSTVTKSIAFFIGAAREADIELGKHVRAPKPPRSTTAKKSNRRVKREDTNDELPPPKNKAKPGMVKITIPLHGIDDGEIYFPENMSVGQWTYALKMAQLILEHYRPPQELTKGSGATEGGDDDL